MGGVGTWVKIMVSQMKKSIFLNWDQQEIGVTLAPLCSFYTLKLDLGVNSTCLKNEFALDQKDHSILEFL